MKRLILAKTISAIAAAITVVAILAIGCGDNSINSGNESKNLNRFLDVFSKNPGQNNGGKTQYTLTVNVSPAEGGTVSRNIERTSYDAGTQVTVTAAPKAGYEFLGWSGASNSGEASVTVKMDGDKTLSAGFKKEGDDRPIYDVYFNANGATGSAPLPARTVSGNTITLPDQASMEKPGYNFAGWNEDKNGAGTRYDANSSYTVTHGVTLYAKWLPVYTVTFNINNAMTGNTPEAVTVDSGTTITLPNQINMTRTGYILDGWNTNTGGTGTNYTANSPYAVTGNITLYAKWTIKKYTVTYNGNGTTSGVPQTVVNVDSGTTITLPTMTRTGYGFDGWYENSAGTGTGYAAGSSYTVNGNATLYAKWIVSAPDTPANVSATAAASSASITVSWSAVSGATEYYVYRSTSSSGIYYLETITTSTSFTNSGLSSGTTYYYKVSAYNSDGESPQSSYVSATTLAAPNTPANVSAEASSSSGIIVSWSAVSGATGYRVYRSTSPSGTYSYATNTTSTSFTNTGLSAGTTYYYKVSAYNSGGESSQSSYVSATTNVAAPNTPANVSATAASSSSIIVSWSAVSGATEYYVYRNTSPFGTYSYLTSTTSTSFTNTGLSVGTTYYYKVSACNSGGESSQSSYVSATTNLAPPNTPTNVNAAAASSSSITVSWSAVSGATEYYVYRSNSFSGTYSYVTSTTSTSFTNTGLSAGTTYYYRVSAYNSGGESSQSSYVSAAIPNPNTNVTTGTFTDTRNNKIYKTVKIGSQTWMAENLNYETSSGSWCYNNSADNCNIYGKLYDWVAAKTACPTGWHLPSSQEWQSLVDYAGGYSTAGSKLKSQSGWNSYSGISSSDEYGFSALPGGYRYYSNGSFGSVGNYGNWWTATEFSSGIAYRRYLYYDSDYVNEGYYDKSCGFSVRCLQD